MHPKKIKIKSASAEPSEDGHTYVIDRLDLGEAANDSESDTKWLLTQLREVQKANKKDKDNSTKVNVTCYQLLKPYKTRKI